MFIDELERHAQAVFAAALDAVRPSALLAELDVQDLPERPLADYRQVRVVGAGKAAMAMAGALESRLEGAAWDGIVTVPHGYPETLPPSERAPARIAVQTAGHPVPDEASAQAGTDALHLAEPLTGEDLLIVLLSGGGSALWFAPVEDVPLAEAQATVQLLLASGADIAEINAVRKHLARVGGGQLARAAAPAEVLALLLSDVVGDDPSVIASGPTVPDPSTFPDALGVLARHGLSARVPPSVRQWLERGARGDAAETPKPGDPAFARVTTHLLGSNRDALVAAARHAEELGYTVRLSDEPLTGEAREAGRRLAREALAAPAGTCLLWGGETTVTVAGAGRGGRNQELALAAALELEGADRPIVLLSGGTDGIDGPTDAAGGWVTPATASAARALDLDPEDHLARNDAYPLLDALGQLLRPGPTHTNVMDVQVALVG